MPLAELEDGGRKRLANKGGKLKMHADSLDKGWGLGKAARVVDGPGFLAAVERAFKRHSKVDRA